MRKKPLRLILLSLLVLGTESQDLKRERVIATKGAEQKLDGAAILPNQIVYVDRSAPHLPDNAVAVYETPYSKQRFYAIPGSLQDPDSAINPTPLADKGETGQTGGSCKNQNTPGIPSGTRPDQDSPKGSALPARETGGVPYSVYDPPSGSPTDLIAQKTIGTAMLARDTAELGRGLAMVDAAREARKATVDSIFMDQKTVSDKYKNLSVGALENRFKTAITRSEEIGNTFDKAVSGMLPGELARFRNLNFDARDKAAAALNILNREKQGLSPGLQIPVPTLTQTGGEPNPLGAREVLTGLFGGRQTAQFSASNEGLVDRIMMFNGLDADEQARILSQLNYVENRKLILDDGKIASVAILNNRYSLTGAKNTLDCSSFVSSLLPADLRKTRFTTLDFRSIYLYLTRDIMPVPPKYPKDREKLIREVSKAFTPVNIYAGQNLAPGDLLIYRVPFEANGHVFLVRRYNPQLMLTEVIEAAQSAGTIREREFSLSFVPPTEKDRPIRPGLMGLRLKPTDNNVCKYKDPVALNRPRGRE